MKILFFSNRHDVAYDLAYIFRHFGMETEYCVDQEDGMIKARLTDPDVLLVDVCQDNLHKALMFIRKVSRAVRSQIIILTSVKLPQALWSLFGANMCLRKPYNMSELKGIFDKIKKETMQ